MPSPTQLADIYLTINIWQRRGVKAASIWRVMTGKYRRGITWDDVVLRMAATALQWAP